MKRATTCVRGRRGAFTLIEILLASVAAAMILVVINGLFVRAIHLRDSATARVRETRLRARAERALRDDLQSSLVSGGILASTLEGGTNSAGGPSGAIFPGYLKLTTTNAQSASGTVGSEVQQVEYFIEKDPQGGAAGEGGVLVRAVTRDLLATTPTASKQEIILTGVQSMQVQFYDGANWQDTWEFNSDSATATAATASGTSTGATLTTGNTTLPEAIRVDVRQAASKIGAVVAPPVEVLVPWSTQPFIGATPVPATPTEPPGGDPPGITKPVGPNGPGKLVGPGEPTGPGSPSGPTRPGGPPPAAPPSGGRAPSR